MTDTRPPLPPDDEPPPTLDDLPPMPDNWPLFEPWPPIGSEADLRLHLWSAWHAARSEADGIGIPTYVKKEPR